MLHSNLQKTLIFSLVVILLAAIALSMLLVSKSKSQAQKTAVSNDINQTSSPPLNSIIRRQTPGSSGKPVSRLNINAGRSYPFDAGKFKNGYKIGGVNIRLSDLDYRYDMLFGPENTTGNVTEQWKKAIDLANKDAIIQNEGVSAGLFGEGDLDAGKIQLSKSYIESSLLTTVSFEKINIYFNNYLNENEKNPEIGTPEAKKIAYDTLAAIRPKLVSGELTMRQAGEEIGNNLSLEKVDKSYKVNAYQKYTNLKFSDQLIDPQIMNLLWSVPPNTVTSIMTGGNGQEEIYYCIVKINSKNSGKFNSVDDLVNRRKADGMAISL